MTCDTCSTGYPSVLNQPFDARSAVQNEAMQNALAMQTALANCNVQGKILAFSINDLSILAAADGVTSKTNSNPALGAIDFLVVQPFTKSNMKLHGVLFKGPVAADLAELSIGQIQLDDGRDIRPRIKGSFSTILTPANALDCDTGYYRCGVDLLNAACLRPGSFENPYEILISNDTGLDIANIAITVLVEYVGS